jgi:hypothetical protein
MASVQPAPAGATGMAAMFMGQPPARKQRKEGDVGVADDHESGCRDESSAHGRSDQSSLRCPVKRKRSCPSDFWI